MATRGFSWQRLAFVSVVAAGLGLTHDTTVTPTIVWILRSLTEGLVALVAFTIFEEWPRHLPRGVARWVVQIVAVVVVIPFGALLAYRVSSSADLHDLLASPARRNGFYSMLAGGLLLAPAFALGAQLRQREAAVREQAARFDLERSELERRAVDAQLRLLQSQVQPHFLFNTLANVRALVAAGSPQAPVVLDSLIAYLRASLGGLAQTQGTLGRELDLVRAYLDLMHMRMPDRFQFSAHTDPAATSLACPPGAVLTLVENAVRHGIDPAEDGGRVDVSVTLHDGRCLVRVIDNGVGLSEAAGGSGSGLANLRERLALVYGGAAQLRLAAAAPAGVCAELEFPARASAP